MNRKNGNSVQGNTTGWFFGICVFSFLLKLVLISDFDISAIGGAHDDYWCIKRSLDGYWFPLQYDQYHAIKEPFWPLLMRGLSSFGIPVRLTMEVIYFIVSVSAVQVLFLRRSGFFWTRILIVHLLFWSPFAIPTLERATYDFAFSMFLMLSLMLAANFACRLRQRISTGMLLLYGATLGLLAITRAEGVILGYVGLFSCAFASVLKESQTLKERLYGAARCLALGSVFFVAVQIPIRMANHWAFGTYALSELEEPEYKRALLDLSMVAPSNPVHQVSIAMESVAKVAELSQEGKIVYEGLKGPIGQGWAKASLGYPPPIGEICGGWAVFAIRDVVSAAGFYDTPERARDFYRRLANSIELGFDAGVLPRRTSVHPMVGPRPPVADLLKSVRLILLECVKPRAFNPVFDVPFPDVVKDYDSAMNRKVHSLERTGGLWAYEGFYFNTVLPSPLVEVTFYDSMFNHAYNGSVVFVRNPEIPSGGGNCGFRFSAPVGVTGTLKLRDFHGRNSEFTVAQGKIINFGPKDRGELSPVGNQRKGIGFLVVDHYSWFFYVWNTLLCIVLVGLILGLRRSALNWIRLLRIAALIFPLVVMRLLICAMIDSSAFYMRDWRYMLPVALGTSYAVIAFLVAVNSENLENSTLENS